MILNPNWTYKYEPYWNSIHKYNCWFIKLRFGAILSLIGLLLFCGFTNYIQLTSIQFLIITFTTLFILCYNLFFRYLSLKTFQKKEEFNEVEFSLYQIVFDLMSLNVLIYFTGGVESPFILFYIFHMIIGSMILPVRLIYTFASMIMVFLLSFSVLEYKNAIYHQQVTGLLHFNIYNDLSFIFGYLFIIGFVMFVAIALTNKIAQDLYQRELQLKKALEELEEAEKTKQRYVMTIVHELKSPISASVSILDMVLGNFYGPIDAKVREKLERIRYRIDDSIENINNILRLSRFRLLNKIDKEIFDLSGSIEKIIENQRPIMDRKNISVYSAIQKLEYFGDKTLITLSLSNIINNSIKYTKEDGLIEILLENKNSEIEIEICDNGIGIPKNDLDKIFTEFFRGSNAKGKNIEGTGTGLSIIKQIIDSHSGRIVVDSPSRIGSETRPGTSFKIFLPVEP